MFLLVPARAADPVRCFWFMLCHRFYCQRLCALLTSLVFFCLFSFTDFLGQVLNAQGMELLERLNGLATNNYNRGTLARVTVERARVLPAAD